MITAGQTLHLLSAHFATERQVVMRERDVRVREVRGLWVYLEDTRMKRVRRSQVTDLELMSGLMRHSARLLCTGEQLPEARERLTTYIRQQAELHAQKLIENGKMLQESARTLTADGFRKD